MKRSVPRLFERIARDGDRSAVTREVAVEKPVAIEFNGIGYAVMMASPQDLEDFAVGFALSERLIEDTRDVLAIDTHEAPTGVVLRVQLPAANAARVVDRVRHRVSDSSCGLCGIDNLEHALRPLPQVMAVQGIPDHAIFAALDRLNDHQALNRATGAVHAAARCSADGSILDVREDVGRHNAFDKLIGAMARSATQWQGGFALLSSRCSYELVEKAALSGCAALVTISAATDLAIARAQSCGLRLVVLARPDAILSVAGRDGEP
ncbi:MAG: sulfurtransferase FdhD [Sphingomonas bacterium]|uniref:formate dehydrogenase accessory sulfurtransferase FdhD n=1 Tax=Sphingomonas bacterium TaxID=1895847 RepID=UPI00260EDAD2|nr:formate dehydrogenase accessory sulfurtransferase FdhD [Sphingomonas bacterium]MDB5706229.1 sulfurtransferase FdhD [Sphingomonas bacterium]